MTARELEALLADPARVSETARALLASVSPEDLPPADCTDDSHSLLCVATHVCAAAIQQRVTRLATDPYAAPEEVAAVSSYARGVLLAMYGRGQREAEPLPTPFATLALAPARALVASLLRDTEADYPGRDEGMRAKLLRLQELLAE